MPNLEEEEDDEDPGNGMEMPDLVGEYGQDIDDEDEELTEAFLKVKTILNSNK